MSLNDCSFLGGRMIKANRKLAKIGTSIFFKIKISFVYFAPRNFKITIEEGK
jgi:hypothetical protein